MRSLRGLRKNALRILLVVAVIAVSNFIGMGLYSLITGREVLSSLWIIFVVEGFVMMLLGVLGTTTLPQRGTIGFPWSESVRAAAEEIRRDRPKQVNFWLQFAIIGFILFILGLVLASQS